MEEIRGKEEDRKVEVEMGGWREGGMEGKRRRKRRVRRRERKRRKGMGWRVRGRDVEREEWTVREGSRDGGRVRGREEEREGKEEEREDREETATILSSSFLPLVTA